ncbi:ABC transporter ATP-binding protein [Tessaracoccus lapidicaptus]|uniref:ABC transporter ATP-binding protein n=1 Tax=Tessaracoccus lapidicaptus TaxID=1427523 RepID=A0A1C0AK77_9ACTN|nr:MULTISPECIES: ABC transporter ATP-binding protein [Tessaracoccus]AQX16926.1 ABC transporter ATP-binding protein [Tessaracoccus sp. T2.5-30]OCL33014.1 ABC transporter ATP-binding protein [Tessaracoccus lapidicaptus]VEP41739.1 High-affinity zinc uptake system ATP-binding protein ZnuC [Tessaracoccus lapidicaptus]
MTAPDPLHAEGLFVSLGGLPILRDVSISVSAGEAVALLGGNGSGKSTLVRTLMGLVPHQEGSISLFGEPLATFRDWSRIGYVPQHSAVAVANATVREIVSSGRLAHRRPFQWLRAVDHAAIDHALDLVGLAGRAGWPFAALSGGQKQRTLIARALASQPELLVMDEPLAGVDLHSQGGLADLLGRLADEGLALLVVLHELGPMAAVLHRAVTLCDGRVVDRETTGAHECQPGPPLPSLTGLADPISGVRS